jgi:glycosyltransferase involved in cell wall biosynthesis
LNPLVSIIIPTYNRAHLIGETLDSVYAQNYKNWECIIVDDGSNDNTDEVIGYYVKKDSRFKYFHRPKEHLAGGNGARNFGFKMSKGEYIQWFDSDDLMDQNLIKEQLNNLLGKTFKISVCLQIRYDEYLLNIQKKDKFFNVKYGIYYDYIARINNINLPTTLFNRIILSDFKFNEKLKKSQEVDFFSRILKQNQKVLFFFNRHLVKIRRHKNSITGSQNFELINHKLIVRRQIIKELPNDINHTLKTLIFKEYFKVLKLFYYRRSFFNFSKNLFKLEKNIFSYIVLFNFLIFYLTNKGDSKLNYLISKYLKKL